MTDRQTDQQTTLFVQLVDTIPPTDNTIHACEKYVCSLYTTSHAAGNTEDDVRYWMFCQETQKSECLPPTSRQPPPAHPTSKLPVLHLEAVTSCPASTARADGHGWKAMDQGWNKLSKSGRANTHYYSCPPTYRWRSQGEQAPMRSLGHHAHWPPTDSIGS